MHMPGRLHIAWDDPNTLRIDTEAGTQTRLLHFGGSPAGDPTWQGYSAAEWEPVNLDLGCPNVLRLKFRERTVMDD